MPRTNQQGIIQQKSKTSAPTKRTMKDYLKIYENDIKRALPAQIGADRFNRICTSLLTNADIGKCTPESLIGCVLNCAQLGLEPNTPLGEAYIIPYGNKCTVQLGYKGLMTLARRSGEIALIKAQTVYENDEFDYQLGLDPDLRHIPAKEDRGRAIAYYAFYKTKDGYSDFEVMYRDEIDKHRKQFSKAGRSPWTDGKNYDAMAKKTVLKKLLKYAPMSAEVARSISQDNTSKDFDSADLEAMKDLSLQPSTIDYEDAEYTEVEPASTDSTEKIPDTITDPVTGEAVSA